MTILNIRKGLTLSRRCKKRKVEFVRKVIVEPGEENNNKGLRVTVCDPDANVADLLDAWQPYCSNDTIYKRYAEGNGKDCRGCQTNCCNTAYLIPDLIAFKKICAINGLNYREGARLFFASEKMTIGLMRLKGNPCIFLKDGLCVVYEQRALLCRFYLCADLLGSTEQLVYSLAWVGGTATQNFALEQKLLSNDSCQGRSSFDLLLHGLLEQYRFDPRVQLFMEARDYRQIPLKPFL